MLNKSVVFIGAGGLAWSLSSALYDTGVSILQIVSSNTQNGQRLAKLVGAVHETSFDRIATADFYFIALPDRLIESVACSISFPPGAILIHSSGSIPLSVLSGHFTNSGVLYPLQTFTRGRVVSLESVPLFIEASNVKTLDSISLLANSISKSVTSISSEERRSLHLAGVIGNNFTNFLLRLSSDWMVKNGFSLHLLQPLMEETIRKAFELSPALSQTGPAIRSDLPVLELHTKMLADVPELQQIYYLFSDLIIRNSKEKSNNDTEANE